MGEPNSLILEELPKRLEYLITLNDYKETSLILKAKNTLTGSSKTKPQSISQWCKILGSSETNPHTRGFLEDLIEREVLKPDGKNGDADLYRLDKNKLVEEYHKSDLYQFTRSLNFETINSEESYRTVVRDINI